MATLIEAYVKGDADIPDIDALLEARHELVAFTLTPGHVRFLVTRMIPEWLIHSRAQDRRIVRDHYDRGDDFFEAFLGETMVYTSGYFRDRGRVARAGAAEQDGSRLPQAHGPPGDELLDVGCGWGTLAVHAAKHFGAAATGITVAQRGAAYGNAPSRARASRASARIECLDYRDIPRKKYDRIVSLEMVEHVGVKNLSTYFEVVRDRLKDDGLFLLQWCGLRPGGEHGVPPAGMRPEDMVWGLFMNEHIFSGADASLPLGGWSRRWRRRGFEVQSTENLSVHYAMTIERWHRNWQRNREAVVRSYGERWYRLWNVFLGWSWRIGMQGTSACYQVLAHKNLDAFDRTFSLDRTSAPAHAARRDRVDSGVAAE